MSPDVDIRPPSPSIGQRRRSRVASVVVVVAATVVLLFAVNAVIFNDPAYVDRVSFENAGPYDIHVALSSDGTNWMPVGVAVQHCTTTFERIIDQGDDWQIRLRAQGVDGGVFTVSRAELAANEWTYVVPGAVAAQLSSSGAPEPPHQGCATPP